MTLHCQPLNGRRPEKAWRNDASNGSPLSGCTVTVTFTWSVCEVTWLKPFMLAFDHPAPTSVNVAHATIPPSCDSCCSSFSLWPRILPNMLPPSRSIRAARCRVLRTNCLTRRQRSRERGESDPPVDTQTTAAAEDLSDWEGRPGSLLWNDGVIATTHHSVTAWCLMASHPRWRRRGSRRGPGGEWICLGSGPKAGLVRSGGRLADRAIGRGLHRGVVESVAERVRIAVCV